MAGKILPFLLRKSIFVSFISCHKNIITPNSDNVNNITDLVYFFFASGGKRAALRKIAENLVKMAEKMQKIKKKTCYFKGFVV